MKRASMAAALAGSTFLATIGYANSIPTTPNDGSLYGNLVNSSTYGWCGATSITNSLQYLQKKYPAVYKNTPLITGGSLDQTRTQILKHENGVTVTGTPPNAVATGNPDSNMTVWNSKIEYINEVAPGTTRFAAMMDPDLFGGVSPKDAGYLNPGNIESHIPTAEFLHQQLEEGEDVEIAINNIGLNDLFDHAVGGGHMVTLTSLDYDASVLTYLDPNDPGHFTTASYAWATNGFLSFYWDNGVNAPGQAYIYEAWAESPVPLPGAAYSGAALLVGMLGFSWFRSKRVPVTA